MATVDTFDWDGLANDLEESMKPFYGDLLDLARQTLLGSLPISVSFDRSNPRVADVVGQLGQNIRGVSDTIRQNVQKLVQDGIEQGQPSTAIAQKLREYGVTDSAARADAIARTESAQAYSAGAVLSYEEAGVEKKKWLASPGSCPECDAMDGEVVGMDEDFSGGVATPPLHPNCTCAVAPAFGDE